MKTPVAPAALLLLAACAVTEPPSAPEEHVYDGVLTSQMGRPWIGVEIQVDGRTTTTDRDGAYELVASQAPAQVDASLYPMVATSWADCSTHHSSPPPLFPARRRR